MRFFLNLVLDSLMIDENDNEKPFYRIRYLFLV